VSASLDSVAPLAAAGLRFVAPLALLWLAFFFGRTLRAGDMPLIERVARIGKPDLSAALCRYTRRLTALWCIYFPGFVQQLRDTVRVWRPRARRS
jgi:uncharacterized membrane protein